MNEIVVLVGGIPAAHRAVLAEHPRAVLVLPRRDLTPDLLSLPVERLFVTADHAVPEQVHRLVQDWLNDHGLTVRAVAAFHDDHHVFAAALASSFGVGYYVAAPSVQQSKDKFQARQVAEEAGWTPVAAYRFEHPDEVVHHLDGRRPWIVKPLSGVSSRSVSRVTNPADLRTVVGSHEAASTSWILEEYVIGREYSVEAWSVDGVHHVLGVTARTSFPDTFVPQTHRYPAPLPAVDDALIRDALPRLLDGFGATGGPSHTEVVIRDGDIILIESQMRLGGGGIAQLITATSGADVFALLAAQALGSSPHLDELAPARAGVVAHLHPATAGARLTRILSLTNVLADSSASMLASARPGVHAAVLRDGSNRMFTLMVLGDNDADADARLAQAVDQLSIGFTVPAKDLAGGNI